MYNPPMASRVEGISCKLCPEVCCKNVKIPLTTPEAEFLREKGTSLRDVTPSDILQAYEVAAEFGAEVIVFDRTGTINTVNGEHMFEMDGECGNLLPRDENGWRKCAAVGDPRRPTVCGSLEEGGDHCTKMRKARNVT
jgi:ferredoxin